MNAPVHILGAGLAGLSAAVGLTAAGRSVIVYEAAGHAGGRCRSYHDDVLGRTIDNGNHLVLSGNRAVIGYLETIGSRQTVKIAAPAAFPFYDLNSGERWTVAPDKGRLPWSWLSAARRVPGASLGDYLRTLRLVRAADDQAIRQVLPVSGALWDRFWAPVIVAVTNTDPAEAAAGPMARVVHETLACGEAACRPVFFPDGLGESLVAPALEFIKSRGGQVRFNTRVREIIRSEDTVVGLKFSDGSEVTTTDGAVVSCLPAHIAADLFDDIQAPDAFSSIVNGHFVLPKVPDGEAFLGLINGTAEWLFRRGDMVSVTISAAESCTDLSSEDIAAAMWTDIVRAYGLGDLPLGPYRILKEKRATFLQTPAQMRRRPPCQTSWRNLFLAGDWTDTGLPATIEGTIRSGNLAVLSVLDF